MTETNAYGPQNGGDDYLTHPTSTGRVVPVVEMRVTDPDGTVLPQGEVGEIWFRGPHLIRGYWNNPAATAETARVSAGSTVSSVGERCAATRRNTLRSQALRARTTRSRGAVPSSRR